MPSSAADAARPGGRLAVPGLALAVAALALLAWRRVLAFELLGWDSYPLILAGRVRSWGELLGTFGEELMDGQLPLARYYRPLAHLAFGLDHALWGLEPAGYHRTDLAILCATGIACFALARRLLGRGWPLLAGAALAGAAYVLHPVHYEILPAPARRADALAVLFTLIALLVQLGRSPETASFPRRVAVALACVAAVASKETGVLATALVVGAAWLGASGGARARVVAALRSTWPALVLLAAFLVARQRVLGELGGNAYATPALKPSELSGLAADQLQALLVPRPPLGERELARALGVLAGTLLFLLLALAVRRSRAPDAHLSGGRTVALLAGWFALLVAVTGLSGVERGWYTLPFLPVWALTAGLLAGHGLSAWREGSRGLAGAAMTAALASVLATAAHSGIFDPAPELATGSRDMRAYLDRFDRAVESAPPGSRIALPGMPVERRVRIGTAARRHVLMLAPYSMSAYAKLRFPDRQVIVVMRGPGEGATREGAVVIEVSP